MEYQQIMAVHGVKSVVSTLACGLEGNGFHDGGWFFGTLLGPEITGPDVSHGAPLCGGCVRGVGLCFFWIVPRMA